MEQDGTRINKYLSELGVCSRREADKWIEQGRVTVNGKHPTPGTRVNRKSTVRVDGRVVSDAVEDDIYLLFNKPVGIVSTTDPGEVDNIVQYVNYPRRIFPVGRLDKASEGLIILTSDGDIVNKILRAGNEHEKEYEVTVDRPIDQSFVTKMSTGIPILGQVTKKCKVEQIAPFTFKITLIQGLNRQIRRMCEYLGYEVKKLKRTRIMHLNLDLPGGEFRDMTAEELADLQAMIKTSSKTAPVKKTNKSPQPAKQAPNRGKKPPSNKGKKPTFSSKNRGSKPKPGKSSGRSGRRR